jgi:uncharacterized protein YndB with AHSA1/START domain
MSEVLITRVFDAPRERIHIDLLEPELLVMRSDPMPGMHEPTVVRVELHDHGERTRMTLTDGPLPAEGRDLAEAGWSAAVDKLAALVAA